MPTLCKKNRCTGCSACANICSKSAINMVPDSEGFLYPEIDLDKCIECGLCEKICPVLQEPNKFPKSDAPIAAFTNDLELRKKSSSGGLFSVLSNEIFNRGGVVVGAGYDPFPIVKHLVADSQESLEPLRGSKYVQSEIGLVYKKIKVILQDNRYVLFTGTPCQVAGLLKYIPERLKSRLITVDLVCHGVPSPLAFRLYLDKLNKWKPDKFSNVTGFSFRNLDKWEGPSSIIVDDEKYLLNDKENIYMKLFLGNYLHRPCCYQCQYTTLERVSDITIADFWKVGSESPFPFDTTSGISLVLTNSEKGKCLFDSIKENITFDIRTWKEAVQVNHQLYKSSSCPKGRSRIYKMLQNKRYEELCFHLIDNPYLRLRSFVGKILRIMHLR